MQQGTLTGHVIRSFCNRKNNGFQKAVLMSALMRI